MTITAAARPQSWFPRILRPRYSWAIQASLWIPLALGLLASGTNPQFVPAFIGVFALASLIRGLVLFSILVSARAHRVFVAAGAPIAEHRKRIWATVGSSIVFSALAGWQAVIMQRWVAP